MKNQWKTLYVGLFVEEETIYQTDAQGNIVYIEIDGVSVPVEIGKKPSGYLIEGEPIRVNLSTSGGEAEAVQYGVTVSDYSAKFTRTNRIALIDETTLLWESEPTVNDDGYADGKTADWRVVKISENQNGTAYLLARQENEVL